VEAFNFALGLGVVRRGVLLFNTEPGEENFVGVSTALQPRGEDKPFGTLNMIPPPVSIFGLSEMLVP